MLPPLIQDHETEIAGLCRKYRVSRLELFGSLMEGRFDPANSDLDFLVAFHGLRTGEYADTYFGLKDSLEAIFHRPVDLVMTSAIKNPYFLQRIQASRTLLYAA